MIVADLGCVCMGRGQGCRGYGDSHGYGYGMGMGTVMNPHGPVGILCGFLIGWRLRGNALNMR